MNAPPEMPPREPRGVQAVETGFSLLAVLAAHGCLGVAELREISGLSRAQIHAYLVSFQRAGLIEKDPRGTGYRVGPFGLELGMAQLLRLDPQAIAAEEARRTAETCGQTISTSVWGLYGPTVTATLQAGEEIRNSARPGTVYSVTGTATGILFAALLPADVIRATAAAQHGEPDPVRFIGRCPALEEIRPQIEQARTHDMAITYSWPQRGVSALAAPVRNFSDEIEMVLTMIGADTEIDIDPQGFHATQMRALAARVSRQLGHVPARD
ncbi:helix-turn-helix domain-containing protein [Pseudooceanicola sp. GBMRC 2024]|uniref:Helix-turn-helix domain-containing protein n=1 Tax=Pseudooceanicola albus TaxID=2692189 RepID=A0A6L7G0I2_9RHOB|nr:helix-turn-helix domain-containing protein [Pseudooceanicola albus]MXN17844.1 helix-turn-helix domain-containing protein [Pseudooceanicola albus]